MTGELGVTVDLDKDQNAQKEAAVREVVDCEDCAEFVYENTGIRPRIDPNLPLQTTGAARMEPDRTAQAVDLDTIKARLANAKERLWRVSTVTAQGAILNSLDDIPALVAEVVSLRRQRDAALALHIKVQYLGGEASPFDFCHECQQSDGEYWPCPTVAALTALTEGGN